MTSDVAFVTCNPLSGSLQDAARHTSGPKSRTIDSKARPIITFMSRSSQTAVPKKLSRVSHICCKATRVHINLPTPPHTHTHTHAHRTIERAQMWLSSMCCKRGEAKGVSHFFLCGDNFEAF